MGRPHWLPQNYFFCWTLMHATSMPSTWFVSLDINQSGDPCLELHLSFISMEDNSTVEYGLVTMWLGHCGMNTILGWRNDWEFMLYVRKCLLQCLRMGSDKYSTTIAKRCVHPLWRTKWCVHPLWCVYSEGQVCVYIWCYTKYWMSPIWYQVYYGESVSPSVWSGQYYHQNAAEGLYYHQFKFYN